MKDPSARLRRALGHHDAGARLDHGPARDLQSAVVVRPLVPLDERDSEPAPDDEPVELDVERESRSRLRLIVEPAPVEPSPAPFGLTLSWFCTSVTPRLGQCTSAAWR
jgi:hypothetical protein